jgi:PhzF family phenazine biosynthesis protein
MQFWTVDAFTTQPFKGNPAAVMILKDTLPDELMQNIAAEINLSETAFLFHKPSGHYDIRWFTPTTEVQLCGHATLAAAHILWHELNVKNDTLYFDSLSGILMATQQNGKITLDFPAYGSEPMAIPDRLTSALGVAPVCVSKAFDDCIVELHSADEVINLTPNISKLMNIDCRAVIITAEAKAGSQYDFVSRFFAPRVGVPEDPVSGSAHCKLAPYWAKRMGKTEFTAYQASKRGGMLDVRFESNRVYLTGQALIVFEGRFLIGPSYISN